MFFDRLKRTRTTLGDRIGPDLYRRDRHRCTGSRSDLQEQDSPRKDEPGARTLLEEVSKAYRGLSSYSDQGEFVVAMTLGGKAQKQVRPLKLTFVRPNKLDLDTGAVRLTSDGKTLTTSVAPLKKYTNAPAPESIGFDTFREGPTGAVLFGGPTGIRCSCC